jgi:hypothetical protein
MSGNVDFQQRPGQGGDLRSRPRPVITTQPRSGDWLLAEEQQRTRTATADEVWKHRARAGRAENEERAMVQVGLLIAGDGPEGRSAERAGATARTNWRGSPKSKVAAGRSIDPRTDTSADDGPFPLPVQITATAIATDAVRRSADGTPRAAESSAHAGA